MAPVAAESRLAVSEAKYDDGAIIPQVELCNVDMGPVVVRLSDDELKTGETRWDFIQEALRYYHRDGFVVLENAIPEDIVDHIYQQMCKDNERFVAMPNRRWNMGQTTGNISQRPPMTAEFMPQDIYANKHLMRVLQYVLGPKPELRFINSNVAVGGGTTRQATHADVYHAFPDNQFGIVVNIYLQDTSPENGVTELWLGTHEHARRDQHVPGMSWIKKEYMDERAKVRPPLFPHLKKGSICIRDLRLWHAGMPNYTDKCRIMLALDYFSQWYQCPMNAQLPVAMKPIMEQWENISLAGIDWLEGDVDHLTVPFFLNMTQDPEEYRIHTEKGTQDRSARETGKYDYERSRKDIKAGENFWVPPTVTANN